MLRSIPTLSQLVLCASLVAATASQRATAACQPVTPVDCLDCFAVFVMPDTQYYTLENRQPEGAAHLDLVTRYICDNKATWTEPSTGKRMPIAMVIQLGDLVQNGDNQLAEWIRVDAAFDNLDACDVPYLVTAGNHDYDGLTAYEKDSVGYETYFGTDRWLSQGYGCATPGLCTGLPGDWFLGGGDPIAANSRNNVGTGSPGPSFDHEARHRAGIIRVPNGQPFLFLGLEPAFDFPPAAPGFENVEGDDAAWPHQVLQTYASVPTIVFHHSLFITSSDPLYIFGIESYHSDSITEGPIPDGMIALWNELIEPYPQIFAAFSGHVLNPARIDDFTIGRASAPPVAGFLRNFQELNVPSGAPHPAYGAGWNAIAAFDPELDEFRVRSYRIDDTNAYADPPIDLDHTGVPAPTECLDVDWGGVGERAVPFAFEPLPEVAALPDGRNLLLVLLAVVALALGVPRLANSS